METGCPNSRKAMGRREYEDKSHPKRSTKSELAGAELFPQEQPPSMQMVICTSTYLASGTAQQKS